MNIKQLKSKAQFKGSSLKNSDAKLSASACCYIIEKIKDNSSSEQVNKTNR